MGWEERFKQGAFGIDATKGNASFRGVPFFLETNGATFGKRLAEHEFPQRNTPFIEELGSSVKKFTVEGYVAGDDHLEQRDNILAACAKPGSAILIHPYYGKLTVQCKEVRPSERTDMLRKTLLAFDFVEAGEFQFSSTKVNTAVNVLSKVDAAYLKLDERFRELYQIAGIPFSEAQQVQKVLNLGVTALADAKKIVGQVAEFSYALNRMRDTVATLFTDAAELIKSIVDLSGFGITDDSVLGDLVVDNTQAFADMKVLWEFAPTRTIPSGPSDVLVQAMQISGVVAAGGIMSKVTFESVEDAQAARQALLAKIDELVLSESPVLDDELFIVLSELRVAVSQDIDERSVNLSRLTSYSVNQALPSLVIANALYGSIDQEESIIVRNKVKHPGFLGPDLQVLLNA
jgi:prophage DNA circulation protein